MLTLGKGHLPCLKSKLCYRHISEKRTVSEGGAKTWKQLNSFFFFFLCAIWKRTLAYHTDVCKRQLKIDAGQAIEKVVAKT